MSQLFGMFLIGICINNCCQITHVMAELTERQNKKMDMFGERKRDNFLKSVKKDETNLVTQDLLAKYSERVDQSSINSEVLKDSEFKVAYSPLNKLYPKSVREILSKAVQKNLKSIHRKDNSMEHPVIKLPIDIAAISQTDLIFGKYISGKSVKIAIDHKQTIQKKNNISEIEKLVSEIEKVEHQLDAASSRFDYQDDPDLVDCCIYEMQSLTAKYSYLLREVRRLGITKNILKGTHADF